jgi:hypothetical protein
VYEITPPNDPRTIPPKKMGKRVCNKEHEFQPAHLVYKRWSTLPHTVLCSSDFGATWRKVTIHPVEMKESYWRFAFIDA